MAAPKTAIFRSSPRPLGNTNALTDVVAERLRAAGSQIKDFNLYNMDIRPCAACRYCQRDWNSAACVRRDDMPIIIEAIQESELLILATPIYSWYCTPSMKAMLDRLVYIMNKYYGDRKGPSLWAGKQVALITTCGYPPEKGADLLEEGIRRYCEHSKLQYRGMLCCRHKSYGTAFMDEEKRRKAEAFAQKLAGTVDRTAGK